MQHLRQAIAVLGFASVLHVGLGVWSLVPGSLGPARALLISTQPFSSLLALWAGSRLVEGFKRHGLALGRMAVLHLFCALALLNRPPEQAFWGLLIGGALLAAWTIGVLGSALGALRGPRWLWSMVSFPVFWATGLGVLAFGSLQAGAEADRWLYALPPAALLASWGLLYVGARQQPGELALLAATLPEGADLLGDALPLRVRYRVPCQVPYGLRVTSLEEGVPLGNPILDHLLGLSTVSPAESARLLSDSEDTVLGLLHRFPDSHLEADAVVFEATAAQLAEAGDTQRALEEGVGAAQALAELLAQVGNTPDQGIDT